MGPRRAGRRAGPPPGDRTEAGKGPAPCGEPPRVDSQQQARQREPQG